MGRGSKPGERSGGSHCDKLSRFGGPRGPWIRDEPPGGAVHALVARVARPWPRAGRRVSQGLAPKLGHVRRQQDGQAAHGGLGEAWKVGAFGEAAGVGRRGEWHQVRSIAAPRRHRLGADGQQEPPFARDPEPPRPKHPWASAGQAGSRG